MTKNEAWVKVGSTVGAAMLCYLVLNLLVNHMALLWKVIIPCIVGIVALIIAFWAGKKRPVTPETQSRATRIGTEIAAKGDVILENVKVDTNSGGDIRVGSNISAKKDVRIKDIQVNSKEKE